jgi:hypothetical protein
MHGLNQIHSINAQAAIDEHHRSCQDALANGHSYIAALDELGRVDVNQKITTFPTVASLKGHALAQIPVHALHKYSLVYGRNN